MRYIHLVAAYLLVLTLLATLPDSAATAALFGFVVTALVVTVVAVGSRKDLLRAVFGVAYGPDGAQRRLRGAFRRQERPDEAGRPMPRAPGAPVGAL
ncbi:DUF6412 domain-containing protein [Rhodococcus sovatensis]|uniref:DUF6412 domain-containing protein n=1 Tax=Rhodococcus sovatensis TaxID=1805840 RepID=A0ABZ2PQE8_9NOCA